MIKDVGILLHAKKEKEFDQRLVLLLKESGRVSVYARGSLRQTYRHRAAIQPFVYSEFVLYEGGSFLSLSQATPITHFNHISQDLEAIMSGMAILDFIHTFIQAGMDSKDTVKLCLAAFYYLNQTPSLAPFIENVFMMKFLFLEGYLDLSCKQCGQSLDSDVFFREAIGICCRQCGGYRVQTGTKEALSYIYSQKPKEVYNFSVSKDAQRELRDILKVSIENTLDRPFKQISLTDIN